MKTNDSLAMRIAQILPGLLLAALILAQPWAGFGQTFSASVTGIVSDPGQAVIADAQVTIRNVNTNDTRRVTTNSTGRYNFSQLVPGTYELTAEVSGFH
jgi:membrane protein involved in colicin uptake